MMRKVLFTILSLAIAFFVMFAFEFVNSFFFPLPEGLDTTNFEAVRAFAQTLPAAAYLLVLAGWFAGSIAAGWALTKYLDVVTSGHVLILGLLLTLCGLANNLLLSHPLWVNVLGLPLFIIGTYGGHWLTKKYGH